MEAIINGKKTLKELVAILNVIDPKTRHIAIAITHVEDALLRLDCAAREFNLESENSLVTEVPNLLKKTRVKKVTPPFEITDEDREKTKKAIEAAI